MKIYLAGGYLWEGEYNWRYDFVKGLSEHKEAPGVSERSKPWPVTSKAILDCLDYVGPYPGHDVGHRCRLAIKEADFIFAWIDGLLPVEIGKISAELAYAFALKGVLHLGVGTTDYNNPSYLDLRAVNGLFDLFDFPFIGPNPSDTFIQALGFMLQFFPVDEQVQFYKEIRGTRQFDDRLKRSGYIYIIKAETGEYKIGRSIDVPNRMKLFAVKLPFDFEIIHHFPCTDASLAESFLHHLYAPQRKRGEWFNLTESDIEAIKQVRYFSDYDFFYLEDAGALTSHPRFNEVRKSFKFRE